MPAPAISTGLGSGKDIYIEVRDDYGNLEQIWQANEYEKQPDGSYLVNKPHVELFHRAGQRTHITADEGTIDIEMVNEKPNPHRGSLSGNVMIIFDIAKQPDRLPVEQRLDEVVRVIVPEEVIFDRDLLRITTDSNVTVLSPEADIYGRGLTIRWNESPRELRLLKLDEGDYLALYRAPEEFDIVSLPGDKTEEPPTEENRSEKDIEEISPIERTVAVEASPPTTMPETTPADESPAKTEGRNIYKAEFFQDVRVDSPQGKIIGAKRLSLTFEWDSKWRRSSRKKPARPAPQPAPLEASTDAELKPVASQPATLPQPDSKETQPLILTWSGPLIMTPVGYTENPSRKRFEIAGEGERLVLSDAKQTEAICKKFDFKHPSQKGELIGSETQPARLELAGEESSVIVCEKISFDRRKGKAFLNGPGYIETLASGPVEVSSQPSKMEGSQSISWADSVEADFESDEETGQYIKEAEFHGKVELQETDTNEYVRCDDLHVWMNKENRPVKANARKNVTARQESTDIVADEVLVDFYDNKKADPKTLTATGNVKVTSAQGEDDPIEALADKITAHVEEKIAILEGEPASIRRSGDTISGEVIRLDEAKGTATVVGKGNLEFLIRKDLDGVELQEPRPLNISWVDGMEYTTKPESIASFRGDINLNSGGEHLSCKRMRVLFEEADLDKESTELTEKKSKSRLGIDVDNYSSQRPAKIEAQEDVVFRSKKFDEDGRVLRRIQLKGPRLVYNDKTSEMNVYGAGYLSAEDYSPPEPEELAEAKEDDLSGNVRSPSQTLFTWKKSMQLAQEDRRAVLTGDVSMVHRSCQNVDATGVNVPDWPELPKGRLTALRCDRLLAKFSKGKEKPRKSATGESKDIFESAGPQLGPLELFVATKDVYLKDGLREVKGQELIYDGKPGSDLVIIWGHKRGQPKRNASLISKDPENYVEVISPWIRWFRKTDRIEAEGMAGTGVLR